MELERFGKVAVIGAGDMGHGIAEVCALAGTEVFLKDVKQDMLDTAATRVRGSLEALARKGRIQAGQLETIMSRIRPCLDYAAIPRDVPIAIEAVPEVMALKQRVFTDIDEHLLPNAIIASNTSNLSISALAGATRRPELVVGLHFFNPVVIMDAVEVVRGERTSQGTFEAARRFVAGLGKLAVPVLKDLPGFLVNRVQVAAQVLINKVVELGMATHAGIDAMARKMAQPMGPFEIFDFVGLDIVKHGHDYFASMLGPEYGSPRWLDDLVAAGHLGKKTGRGIYDWSAGRPAVEGAVPAAGVSMLDLIAVQINEAVKLVEAGAVEDPGDIDVAIANGTGNKAGIFGMLAADRCGIIKRLGELASSLGIGAFKPHPLLSTMPAPNARKAAKRLQRWAPETPA
ncbi:MAG: 3-hydroxyacyl-CoA dehydrogenase family protein [Candidatus Lokiarchaeota archaeon]|nr:3-hydroxyacyl-CoA dehydrogenase family protein [Candidatus Lokiarchaeota archaeon]